MCQKFIKNSATKGSNTGLEIENNQFSINFLKKQRRLNLKFLMFIIKTLGHFPFLHIKKLGNITKKLNYIFQ